MGKGKINHEADGKLRVKEGISTQAHILNQSYVVGSSCTWLQSARYDPVVRWLWKRHTKREKERERERKRERERERERQWGVHRHAGRQTRGQMARRL
jgi:hypothetical protein